MMRLRPVWTTNLAALVFGFGMFASFVLVPEFVEFIRKQPDAALDVLAALTKRIRRADALLKQRVQDPNELIEDWQIKRQ